MKAVLKLWLLILLLASGASSHEATGVEVRWSSQPVRCPVSVDRVAMTCGVLTVPENRADPSNRRQVRLHYASLPARKAPKHPDPLVFLTGGPGSSAFYFIPNLAASPLRDDRDIIVLEQRGNGYSDPALLCDEDPAKLADCHSSLRRRGIDLGAFNTTQSSHDLADLKSALQIDQWNVVGVSMGTFWALRYVSLHPDGVRSLLLDSPYPLQADPRNDWAVQLDALTAIFDACAGDPGCSAAYPRLRERFVRIVQQWNVAPKQIPLLGSFDGNFAYQIVVGTGFESSTVRYVPRLILAMENGELRAANRILSAEPYRAPKGFRSANAYSVGLALSLHCSDDEPFTGPDENLIQPTPSWPADIEAASRGAGGFDRSAVCRDVWRVPASEQALNAPVHTEVPALILVGAFDPSTPPRYGKMMAGTLPNATLAVVPGASHAVLSEPSGCVSRLTADFLSGPRGGIVAPCLEAARRSPFTLPAQPLP